MGGSFCLTFSLLLVDVFNRIDCDWTLMGSPRLIPVSLGDLAGCSVRSQVPHWVISSAPLVLIQTDILMSGTAAWSALLNLTPYHTTPPLLVPLCSQFSPPELYKSS